MSFAGKVGDAVSYRDQERALARLLSAVHCRINLLAVKRLRCLGYFSRAGRRPLRRLVA